MLLVHLFVYSARVNSVIFPFLFVSYVDAACDFGISWTLLLTIFVQFAVP